MQDKKKGSGEGGRKEDVRALLHSPLRKIPWLGWMSRVVVVVVGCAAFVISGWQWWVESEERGWSQRSVGGAEGEGQRRTSK